MESLNLLSRNPDGTLNYTYDLKEARLHTKLPWREFVKDLGMPLSTYQLIESGTRAVTTKQREIIDDYFFKKNITVRYPCRKCTDFTLKGLRKFKGWTQAEVAEMLDLRLATYKAWEQGRYVPRYINYWRLVDLYGLLLEQNDGVIDGLCYIETVQDDYEEYVLDVQ